MRNLIIGAIWFLLAQCTVCSAHRLLCQPIIQRRLDCTSVFQFTLHNTELPVFFVKSLLPPCVTILDIDMKPLANRFVMLIPLPTTLHICIHLA